VGQYRLRELVDRRTEGMWEGRDRLAKTLNTMVGESGEVDLVQLMEKLESRGFRISCSELLDVLKCTASGVRVRGSVLDVVVRGLSVRDRAIVMELLEKARKRGLEGSVLELLDRIRGRFGVKELMIVVEDLLRKFRTPAVLDFWIRAWNEVAKGKFKIPAYLSMTGKFIELSSKTAVRLGLSRGTVVRVEVPWSDKCFFGIVSTIEPMCRISIKGQLKNLIEFSGLRWDRILKEIERRGSIAWITIEDRGRAFFFGRVHTRGRLDIPVDLVDHLGRGVPIFLKLSNGKGKVIESVKVGTERIRVVAGREYRECYVQFKGLASGLYYVEAMNSKYYLSSLNELKMEFSGFKIALRDFEPIDPVRLGRYTFNIGKGVFEIGGVSLDSSISVDVFRNTLKGSVSVEGGGGDVELRMVRVFGSEPQVELRIKNEIYSLVRIEKYRTSYEGNAIDAYLLMLERRAGSRVRVRKVLFTPVRVYYQCTPMFHHLLSLRFPISPPDYRIYHPRLMEEEFAIGDKLLVNNVIGFEISRRLYQEICYWSTVKGKKGLGIIGESIINFLKEPILEFLSGEVGLPKEELSMNWRGTKKYGLEAPDFEIYHRGRVVAVIEVSLGKDLKAILHTHLIPEMSRRLTYDKFKDALGIVVGLEYSPTSPTLKMIFIIRDKSEMWMDRTRDLYGLLGW